ncbi:MAG: M24 family metallopeptidase [Bdellovibrionota bacterium]
MKHAANITRLAFDKVFQNLKPGMNEREVHGMLTGEYFRLGAEMEAYGSIVAGGDNACILHYVKNDQTLRDNDLILIDSGAQFEYYASDVTRTFPVGNKFSNEQRALYEIVLKANEEAIEMVKPGVTLPDIHSRAVEVLVEGLLR